MTTSTEALNNAASQLLAFLAETKKSNVYVIHAVDVGTADHMTLLPTPAVAAWSDDLVVIADVAHPNTTTTPDIRISDLPAIPILQTDSSAPSIGQVSGCVMFKIRGSGTPGAQAQIMSWPRGIVGPVGPQGSVGPAGPQGPQGAPSNPLGEAKAWAVFDPRGSSVTIFDSVNVSSLTKDGAGKVILTMPAGTVSSTNYGVLVGIADVAAGNARGVVLTNTIIESGSSPPVLKTLTQVELAVGWVGGPGDPSEVYVWIFGR